MAMYKNYKIEKLTRNDWIVYTAADQRVALPGGKWSFLTKREAMAFIDTL